MLTHLGYLECKTNKDVCENPWLDSDKELIEIINCRLTVSGAEKVRKSEMLNRCFPNLFRLRLSVHFADVQNL